MGKVDDVITDFIKREEVKKTGEFISENSIAAIAIVSLGLFLYTYFNIQAVFNPPIDQQELTKERQKLAQNQIRFEGELIERIQNLKEVNVDTNPKDLGTDNNPFN